MQGLRTGASWRAWAALAVLDLFLLSPLAIDETRRALSVEGLDKMLVFSVPVSLLWLVGLHVWIPKAQRLHLTLMPLHVAAAFDLFLVVNYQARLSSSTLSVMLDNTDSAAGYVTGHFVSLLATVVAIGALYALAVRQLKGLTLTLRPVRWWWPVVGLLIFYGAAGVKQARAANDLKLGVLDVLSHDRNCPVGVVPQAAIAWQVHRMSARPGPVAPLGAHRDGAVERRVVVLVIGESSRPDHWGLYGYPRPTTPKLSARSDLLVYRDVVSEAALTALSLPLMLARSDPARPERIGHEASIVTAYREAGWRTEWLSTQQRDQWTGQLNRQANEAGQQLYFERHMDGVLVPALARSLSIARQDGVSLFAVLHTQGSHFAYRDRYPRAGAAFKGGQLNDEYDNTVHYTDAVLEQVIELLAKEDEPVAMLYVADHGENLRDDARQLLGHFFSNEYDLPVPMLMWLSPKWVEAEPERALAARVHLGQRLSTSVVFHTVADLGRVAIDGDEGFERRSLLRATTGDQPRKFLRADQSLGDFDQSFPRLKSRESASRAAR